MEEATQATLQETLACMFFCTSSTFLSSVNSLFFVVFSTSIAHSNLISITSNLCVLYRTTASITVHKGSYITVVGPLSDAELSDLAVMLGVRHTRFALLLELSQNDVEVARANYQNSQYEQAMELLFKWKKREGNANRSKLINVAMKLTDPSEDVIRLLKFGKR